MKNHPTPDILDKRPVMVFRPESSRTGTATVHELRLNPAGQVRRSLTELHDIERTICKRLALIERGIEPGCDQPTVASEITRNELRKVANSARSAIASIELAAKRAALED